MPELPEVEYVRVRLDRWLRGARILRARADDARVVRPMKPLAFARGLEGRKVTMIERRGKWLRLVLDEGHKLFVHLGMTGWFEREGPSGNADSHNPLRSATHDSLAHARVHFEVRRPRKRHDEHIAYVDPRRWGRLLLVKEDIEAWTRLGPDPLTDGIDLHALASKLAGRKKQAIKQALMDQSVLAGIGNIQAIEGLWKACVDPRSSAAALTPGDLAKVSRGLMWTIARTLVDLSREDVRSTNPFKIYGRKGEPCPRCRTPLERFELGKRTTMMCPGCQRERK